MTKEQSYFLQILSDHLHQRQTERQDALDWDVLKTYADQHNLSGIVWYQCRSFLQNDPELSDVAMALEKAFQASIFHAATLQYDLMTVSERFREESIPFIPVKGAVVAEYYPEPALRTMGDIDFVIQHADHDRICTCMKELGYSITLHSEKEMHFAQQNAVFEMQEELIHDHGKDGAALYAYFTKLWEHAAPKNGSSEYSFDPNFHFLYLIAHIAKHLKWIGVGFRQFYDIAVLIRKAPLGYFNWEAIQKEAERCELKRFLQACFALCEQWFQVPSPLPESEFPEELAREVTEKVFSDGVFGFQNEKNRIHKLEYHRRVSKAPLFLIKLRTLRELTFPPYKDLISSEKYSLLRGRPYLLPYIWSKRLIMALRKKGNLDSAASLVHADEKKIRERQRLLRDLGL